MFFTISSLNAKAAPYKPIKWNKYVFFYLRNQKRIILFLLSVFVILRVSIFSLNRVKQKLRFKRKKLLLTHKKIIKKTYYLKGKQQSTTSPALRFHTHSHLSVFVGVNFVAVINRLEEKKQHPSELPLWFYLMKWAEDNLNLSLMKKLSWFFLASFEIQRLLCNLTSCLFRSNSSKTLLSINRYLWH